MPTKDDEDYPSKDSTRTGRLVGSENPSGTSNQRANGGSLKRSAAGSGRGKPDSSHVNFRGLITTRRQQLQLSQKQVAERANVSVKQYRRIERGESEPRNTTKSRILQALMCDAVSSGSNEHRTLPAWHKPTLSGCYKLGYAIGSTGATLRSAFIAYHIGINVKHERVEGYLRAVQTDLDLFNEITDREKDTIEAVQLKHWPAYPDLAAHLKIVVDTYTAHLWNDWSNVRRTVEDEYWFSSFIRDECVYLQITQLQTLASGLAALQREVNTKVFDPKSIMPDVLERSSKRFAEDMASLYGENYGWAFLLGSILGLVFEHIVVSQGWVVISGNNDLTESKRAIERAIEDWEVLSVNLPVLGIRKGQMRLEIPIRLPESGVCRDDIEGKIDECFEAIEVWNERLEQMLLLYD